MLNSLPELVNSRLKGTNKSNPCPLCGNTSGHDKFSGKGVLCHNGLDGALAGNGWKFAKNTKDDQWGIYYPDGQGYAPTIARKLREQRREKEKAVTASITRSRQG